MDLVVSVCKVLERKLPSSRWCKTIFERNELNTARVEVSRLKLNNAIILSVFTSGFLWVQLFQRILKKRYTVISFSIFFLYSRSIWQLEEIKYRISKPKGALKLLSGTVHHTSSSFKIRKHVSDKRNFFFSLAFHWSGHHARQSVYFFFFFFFWFMSGHTGTLSPGNERDLCRCN